MIAKKIFFVFSFLFFIALQNNALGTSCTTSSNCPRGEYCSTNAGPNGGVCAACNRPTFHEIFTTNGKKDNDPNSCEWETGCEKSALCSDGSSNCGTIEASEWVTGSGADKTNALQKCNYDKITCKGGYYSKSNDQEKCYKCPYGSTSEAGATSIKNCFFDSDTTISSDDGTIPLPDIMYIYQ